MGEICKLGGLALGEEHFSESDWGGKVGIQLHAGKTGSM